jgi:hypothetical protein
LLSRYGSSIGRAPDSLAEVVSPPFVAAGLGSKTGSPLPIRNRGRIAVFSRSSL